MTVLWIIPALLAVLILVILLRAVTLKPTAAKTAQVKLDDGPRAKAYGRQLSQLVQMETVSNRFEPDRQKFLDFHKKLEEMFPLLHQTCEKHVFNGSLLFCWKGKGNGNPILLMSHHDVVEANGNWEHAPFGGEIDIMERVYTSAWKIWQTYHTEETGELGGGNPDTYNVKGVRSGLGKKEDWTKWNTVGIEWSREGLQWSINGVRTKRVESESGNIRAYPFTEESAFFLIFNMSVVRNSGFAGTAADDFYNHLDIDYVKITPNADTVFRDCPYYRHSAEEGDVL